jgi:hypothetical protein
LIMAKTIGCHSNLLVLVWLETFFH